LKLLESAIEAANLLLEHGQGAGNDYFGWVHLPSSITDAFLDEVQACADELRKRCEVVIVAGIGGSYLGARAAIEFLKSPNYNALKKDTPDIYYTGNSISSTALAELLEICEGRDVSINMISKSGTTTEPAIAFRVFRELLEKKYGKDGARERIFCTTDKAKGTLKKLADTEGYETFVVPDDVGGRFSVLTAVGLLPIAVAGIDIRELMKGAKDASKAYKKLPMSENPCYQYAAVRNCLLRSGYSTEVMVNYEPSFHYMTEWWKQLYGESEGKDRRGIFPAGVDNTTDLHSMGQFIQDGARIMYETVVQIDQPRRSFEIPNDKDNLDGLNFLSGMDMNEVNAKAMQGTILAHVDGKVPNMAVHMAEQNAYNLVSSSTSSKRLAASQVISSP